MKIIAKCRNRSCNNTAFSEACYCYDCRRLYLAPSVRLRIHRQLVQRERVVEFTAICFGVAGAFILALLLI